MTPRERVNRGYLVHCSIVERINWPIRARNCSVYLEWNCFNRVRSPRTRGSQSIWSAGRLHTTPARKKPQSTHADKPELTLDSRWKLLHMTLGGFFLMRFFFPPASTCPHIKINPQYNNCISSTANCFMIQLRHRREWESQEFGFCFLLRCKRHKHYNKPAWPQWTKARKWVFSVQIILLSSLQIISRRFSLDLGKPQLRQYLNFCCTEVSEAGKWERGSWRWENTADVLLLCRSEEGKKKKRNTDLPDIIIFLS